MRTVHHYHHHCHPHSRKVRETCWRCCGTGRIRSCDGCWVTYTWTDSTTIGTSWHGCNCCCHCWKTCPTCGGAGYIWVTKYDPYPCPCPAPWPKLPPVKWHEIDAGDEPKFVQGMGVNKRKQAR